MKKEIFSHEINLPCKCQPVRERKRIFSHNGINHLPNLRELEKEREKRVEKIKLTKKKQRARFIMPLVEAIQKLPTFS